MNKYASLVILFFLFSCFNNENLTEKYDELNDVRWIQGSWADTTTFNFLNPPKYFLEKWESYPDSLSGVGMQVNGIDTSLSEQFCIRMVKGKLLYIARPKNQSMIAFTATKINDSLVCFNNSAHDFPQEISYELKGIDSMKITLKGVVKDHKRELIWHFKRVDF